MKIRYWFIGIGLCLISVVVGGWFAAEWMVHRFTPFDLSVTPQILPDFVPSAAAEDWRTVTGNKLVLRIPQEISRRQTSSVQPDALILTNSRQTLWISVMIPQHHSRMTQFWYRACLHSNHNPLLLMGKASIVPPLGTRRPEFWQRKVGSWDGFFYASPKRMVADLFHDSGAVRVVMISRDQELSAYPWIYDFLTSIRYRT